MSLELAGRVQAHVRGTDNVTSRKRAAEAIRASEKHHREFFERNLTGTFRSMPDGRLLECNDSFMRMLGYTSQEEILNHSVWDLYFHPTDREPALRRLLDQKVVMNEEFQLRRKDGSSMWILANRLLNETEHPSVIEGTAMDISRQKEAESDIRSLLKISKTLNSTRDIDALMDAVISEAVKMTGAECGWSGMRTPEGLVHKALDAGARGYVLKSDAEPTLLEAIEAVRQHKAFFASKVAAMVLEAYLKGGKRLVGEKASPHELTPRERQIVQLLAEGKSNKEVASALAISLHTVVTHRSNIMHKLEVHSVSDLVRYAIRNNLASA